MKKQITLNIGLNVGTSEPQYQLDNTLTKLANSVTITDVKIAKGTYEGMVERTVVCKALIGSYTIQQVIEVVSWIAENLMQDSIAFMLDGDGYIAFNPNYKGERMAFNKDYFLTF